MLEELAESGGLTPCARKQPVSDSKTQYLTPHQSSEGQITSNQSGKQSGRATEKEIRNKAKRNGHLPVGIFKPEPLMKGVKTQPRWASEHEPACLK